MGIVGFIVVGVVSIISIVGSCILVDTKKNMLTLYFLFDSIFVACIMAISCQRPHIRAKHVTLAEMKALDAVIWLNKV